MNEWIGGSFPLPPLAAPLTIRPGFPGHVLFLSFVRASGRVFENRRFVRVFGPIRKYIRTLPIAKAYDGMRQRKLVSFYCGQRNETSCMLYPWKEFSLYTTQFQASVMQRLLHIACLCSQPKLLKSIRSSGKYRSTWSQPLAQSSSSLTVPESHDEAGDWRLQRVIVFTVLLCCYV